MQLTPRVDISPAVLAATCTEFRDTGFGGPSQALSDLTAVGESKPLGYVPLHSLNSYYRVDVPRLIGLLTSVGIETTVAGGPVHGGDLCLFAYDRAALGKLLQTNRAVVESYGWSTDPLKFIDCVESHEVPITAEIYRVIAEAFGDQRCLQLWHDHHRK